MAVIKTKAISLAQRLVSMHYSYMLPIPQVMIGYSINQSQLIFFGAQNILLQGHLSNKLPRFCNWWTAKTTNTTSCLNRVALSITTRLNIIRQELPSRGYTWYLNKPLPSFERPVGTAKTTMHHTPECFNVFHWGINCFVKECRVRPSDWAVDSSNFKQLTVVGNKWLRVKDIPWNWRHKNTFQ